MAFEAQMTAERPVTRSSGSVGDYDVVREVIEFLTENWRDQPSLEAIAARVRMEPTRLQKVFTRWAGLSPKGFLQAVTLDHARALLEQSATVLDTTYEVGLSGPGRLHDLFVTHEAVTPGIYRARGEGLVIRYGFHPSPFGTALIMATEYGLAGLAFADDGGRDGGAGRHDAALAEGRLCRGQGGDGSVRTPRLRSAALEPGGAAAHRADRDGFRDPRVGDAAQGAARLRHDLFRRGAPHRPAEGGARGRRGGRTKTRSPSSFPVIACSGAPAA